MESRLDKFIKGLYDYINITLKIAWKFKETYQIIHVSDQILLYSTEGTELGKILEIPKYKKLFQDALLPVFSQIYPSARKHGIKVDLQSYNKNSEIYISPEKLLYLDIIPKELLINILFYMNIDIIKKYVNSLSNYKNGGKLYEDILKYKDI